MLYEFGKFVAISCDSDCIGFIDHEKSWECRKFFGGSTR